ncbi:hypothetical protein ANTQUA_LOCUS2225 [Anthophora quadrimaculata]
MKVPQKFGELKLSTLKDICVSYYLKQLGLKTEVIARLIEHFGSEELPVELVQAIDEENSTNASDVSSLRVEMEQLKEVVGMLAKMQLQPSHREQLRVVSDNEREQRVSRPAETEQSLDHTGKSK